MERWFGLLCSCLCGIINGLLWLSKGLLDKKKGVDGMEMFKEYIEKLDKLEFEKMYENDFFLIWEKIRDELEVVFIVVDILCYLRENNILIKIFDSGLGIFLFWDNFIRICFSFVLVCNFLGLEV